MELLGLDNLIEAEAFLLEVVVGGDLPLLLRIRLLQLSPLTTHECGDAQSFLSCSRLASCERLKACDFKSVEYALLLNSEEFESLYVLTVMVDPLLTA